MGRVTKRTPAVRIDLSDPAAPLVVTRPDTVTVEEPLEIRVGRTGRWRSRCARPVTTSTWRSGFLLTEGLIGGAADVAALMHCQDEGEDGRPTYNVVDVVLRPGRAAARPPRPSANFYTTSAPAASAARPASTRCGPDSPYDVHDGPPSARPERAGAGCRTRCASTRRSSTAPAACTRPACSPPTASCWSCARTSAGTTPSTRSIGWAAREGRLPLTGLRADGQRPGQLRADPEGA